MTNEPPPITDSPWLWAAVFTACGLAALIATGGKFGKRQANIENAYQARAAVASGQIRVQQDGAGATTASGAPKYTRPGETAIPIWPLEVLLGVICAGSFAMLLRQRMSSGLPPAPT